MSKTRILIFFLLIMLIAGCRAADPTGTPENLPLDESNEAGAETYTVNVFLNSDFHFPPYHKDGSETERLVISGPEHVAFLNALDQNKNEFTAEGIGYAIFPLTEGSYRITRLIPVADVILGSVNPYPEKAVDAETLQAGYDKALAEGQESFELDRTYFISDQSKPVMICELGSSLMATQAYAEPYNPDNAEITATNQFRMALENALVAEARTFGFMGKNYTALPVPGGVTVLDRDGDLFAEVSRYLVVPESGSKEPPLVFKNKARESIAAGKPTFTYINAAGVETFYEVTALEGTAAWTVVPRK